MATNVRHLTAEDAYIIRHAEALELLARLQEKVENMPAPDATIHWGHVGDVGHIVEKLEELLDPN